MIKEIPEKLIGFDPPDYALDGSEVLEMIKDMPEKINLPINRKMNSREEMYAEMRAKSHPEREVSPLEKETIEVLYYAVQEMFNEFKMFKSRKENYSILKYNVLLFIHSDYDIAEVAFCPKIESFIDGVPFDVPNQGTWINGPGVDFYFALTGHELLKKYYMR